MTIRAAAVALAAFALSLAACSKNDDTAATPTVSSTPIAQIAPPAGKAWTEVVAVTPKGGFVIGNPDAPLKLVEYASHTCHVCADFSKQGAAAMDKYVDTGVISYEIRNLVRDPVDLSIAVLARCGSPEAFHPLANQAWGQFDELMNTVQANGAALEQAQQAPEAQRLQAIAQASGIMDFFAARGVSRDQGMQCLGNTAKATQIAETSQAQATELDIQGTPSFFLNGRKLDVTTWAALEPVLQQAGAR